MRREGGRDGPALDHWGLEVPGERYGTLRRLRSRERPREREREGRDCSAHPGGS